MFFACVQDWYRQKGSFRSKSENAEDVKTTLFFARKEGKATLMQRKNEHNEGFFTAIWR